MQDNELTMHQEEDPFYDESVDALDSKWIKEKRGDLFTDGTLCCPLCITPVTFICQRHSVYHHQYRSIFPENCIVDYDTTLTPHSNKKMSVSQQVPHDLFYAVNCSICQTQVAVLDDENIYHFFDVVCELNISL